MAGCVYVVIHPTGFWGGFTYSELVSYLSLLRKEGLLMIKKALGEILSYAVCITKRVIAFWETHLPSGQVAH